MANLINILTEKQLKLPKAQFDAKFETLSDEEKKTAKPKPVVEIGDTVRVHVLIKEGEKERVQVFEGIVIAKKHGGIQETFTVRRLSYGVGVEKVFPLHSPHVEKVELVRHGKVRRAKLYYLRGRVGKAAKVRERIVNTPKGEKK